VPVPAPAGGVGTTSAGEEFSSPERLSLTTVFWFTPSADPIARVDMAASDICPTISTRSSRGIRAAAVVTSALQ